MRIPEFFTWLKKTSLFVPCASRYRFSLCSECVISDNVLFPAQCVFAKNKPAYISAVYNRNCYSSINITAALFLRILSTAIFSHHLLCTTIREALTFPFYPTADIVHEYSQDLQIPKWFINVYPAFPCPWMPALQMLLTTTSFIDHFPSALTENPGNNLVR